MTNINVLIDKKAECCNVGDKLFQLFLLPFAISVIGQTIIVIIIIIITTTMFMVLSSWHSHCESSSGSFDECRLSAGWPPTLRPNQLIWAVSPPKGWLLPSADTIAIYYYYSFYHPTEGGRLSRPRHCSKDAQPVPKAVYRSDRRDKHDRPRWDSNLGPLVPQSGILSLSHHNMHSPNFQLEASSYQRLYISSYYFHGNVFKNVLNFYLNVYCSYDHV